MEYFLYSVDLPFSKKTIFYREINSKEQLILSKISSLYPFKNTENIIEYCRVFKDIILNCIKNKEDFLDINLIDYILFLIKLRIVSVGDDIALEFNPEKDGDMKERVSLNLAHVMKNIYDLAIKVFDKKELNFDNITISLDWPPLESESILLKKEENSVEDQVLSTIVEYIRTIKIKNKIIDLKSLKKEEKTLLFQSLPLTIKNQTQKIIVDVINNMLGINIFGAKRLDYFKFNFYNGSFQEIQNFLFNFNLKSIYKEYYVLASRNINPKYVDSLSISERIVFCSLFKEETKSMEKNINAPLNKDSMDLKALMDEFGE